MSKSFEQLWFQLTPEKAATETYDIIIVGTGLGAGVVAGDLFDTNSRLGSGAKSVLVIEKGGLPFHSHCLNASRPSGFGEDRGQQNDTFFSLFKENYRFKDATQAKLWNAGTMFNLGGRGAAWGLFSPRIHDEYLRKEFGDALYLDLVQKWYSKADELMDVFLPNTNSFHQHLIERLNITTGANQCQWQWGRIASQFSQSGNFDFAAGAFSPIDKLLEIAMSKRRNPDGTCVEHVNWKILLRTEVRSILWSNDSTPRAIGVIVRDANGKETQIFLKKDNSGKTLTGAKVVLGAGSVGSPAILMRSGLTSFLKRNDGLYLTDHDIFAVAFTFRYLNPSVREKIGSMKLQSYVRLKSGKIALVNMAIDSFSFLPRGFLPMQYFTNRDFPQLVVAFILPAALNRDNTIDLDSNGEPVLTAGREEAFSNGNTDVAELRELTKGIINTITEVLKLELRPTGRFPDDDKFFKVLELGGVAHELGTIPLKCYNPDITPQRRHLLEPDLKLRGHDGVHVCDLSIFPFSPEVNPTPTLVAFALRLSRTVLLPLPFGVEGTVITVMNQSGERIKVIVSNAAGDELTQEEKNDNRNGGKELLSGDILKRRRTPVENKLRDETVMVYKLDFNTNKVYLPQPFPYVASPGRVCAIL